MNLTTEIFGDVIVVHALEELGDDSAVAFQDTVTTLEQQKVIVDLDGTESFESEGLAALLVAQDELRLEGGDLKIISSNAVNRKILEITRIDQHLEVFESVIDAVKSFV